MITILGCGDSAGVPRIGGDWGNCDPTEPRNRRTRPSIMVQSATTTLVVDTGPDFNVQMTREQVRQIDAVLYTHAHSDHITGMDELRIFQGRSGRRVPIYVDATTLQEVRQRFGYMFEQVSSYYPPVVDVSELTKDAMGREFFVGDIPVVPFIQDHGQGIASLGFRFGNVGYSTDMCNLDEAAIDALKGIDVWIADCADYAHGHGTLHSTFENVKKLNAHIGARQVYLTHLKMFYDYQSMCRDLPQGFAPAYDGLQITVR